MGLFDRLSKKKNIQVDDFHNRINDGDNLSPRPKKIGVAFGGGGLKGTAHVGVLKVFSEYNIPIHMVAGTSIGSAVAALYASGYDWEMMHKIFMNFDIESLLKVRPSRKGLIPADGYVELIRACTKNKRIEDMDLPLKIVAVDLVSRKKILFDRGDTAIAVRASSAIPGVFTPVKMDDMLLVDGYILDNCPGSVVRDMGADVVIAIDLHAPNTSMPKNILEIVNRSMDIAAASYQVVDADLVLSPIDTFVDSLSVEVLQECFDQGEACARKHIDKILELTGG